MTRIASALVVVSAFALAPSVARADDKADCIAALDSAQALRTSGKLTLALTRFAVCARDVCPRSLQKECVDEASQTSALLPSVVLSAADTAHNDMTDVKVSIDGAVVSAALDGRALPVDPGLHTFRFEKAGFVSMERSLVVKEAQKGQLIAVQLATIEPAHAAPQPQQGWSTPRWVGVGAGAAGAVGIVLGSVFGAMAFSEWSTAQNQAKSAATYPQFAGTKSTGETDATVSTAAFIAGGVLAATGVVLFVASPSKTSSTSAAVTPSLGGLALDVKF